MNKIKENESLKKITKTIKINDYEVLTDTGFIDIVALHETIEYNVYHLKLSDGKELKCADNHIVFDKEFNEIFIKNLKIGDIILVNNDNNVLSETQVISISDLGYKEIMYDLELKEGSDRRYYTNGILSHNTLLAKELAEFMFGDKESLIRIDMSEYMEKHNVSRLIGSPPGFVGHEQGGQLTEKVRRKPYSVILFDEIEKAHEDVFNLFLQLFDEGELTDGLGRKVNFKNCLIILTSNIGVSEVNSFGKSMGFQTTNNNNIIEEMRNKGIIEKALKKKFKPEFLNRISDVIYFNKLNEEDIHKIVYIEINKLEKRINEIGYKFKISDDVIKFIGKEGFDESYGARPLKRTIQVYIEDAITDEILNSKILEGDTVSITLNKESNGIVVKGEKTKKTK